MVVSNCRRCKRVFQRGHSPLCPECYHEHVLNFSHVYRFVQDNPSKTLEEIALHCNVPLSELRSLFFRGSLGTATEYVLYHCLRCGTPLAPIHRCGRFCLNCTEKVEMEAGIHPKGEENPPGSRGRRPAPEEPPPAQQTETPRTEAVPERYPENYGFKRAT